MADCPRPGPGLDAVSPVGHGFGNARSGLSHVRSRDGPRDRHARRERIRPGGGGDRACGSGLVGRVVDPGLERLRAYRSEDPCACALRRLRAGFRPIGRHGPQSERFWSAPSRQCDSVHRLLRLDTPSGDRRPEECGDDRTRRSPHRGPTSGDDRSGVVVRVVDTGSPRRRRLSPRGIPSGGISESRVGHCRERLAGER